MTPTGIEALERIAENARELGLDYEQPAQPIIKSYLEKDNSAQQEPVATLWQHGETGRTRITMPGDITDCDARWFKAADLYTSPPAQRTWVGLTNEGISKEVETELTHYWNGEYIDTTGARDQLTAFARAIEAKLKELNT